MADFTLTQTAQQIQTILDDVEDRNIKLLDEYIKPTSDAITSTQCKGGIVNSYGQSTDIVYTLPAAAMGLNFLFVAGTTVAKYIRFDPQAGDSIYLDSLTTGDGKYVGEASVTKGDTIQFFCFKTGAETYDWFAISGLGSWASEA